MDKKQSFLECERNRVFYLLMMSSGMLGAFTYCVRGGVFCNAQTGNIVLLGMAIGHGNWKEALYLIIPITAYCLGAVVSEILPGPVKKTGVVRWDTLLTGIEIAVTLLLGFLPESTPFQISQVAINFICSMQYNTFRQAEGIPMATTFCTNHVRQTGISLVKWLLKGNVAYSRKFIRHAGMLLMFIIGAVLSTVLCNLFTGKAIWGTSIILCIVFIDLFHADLTKEKEMFGRVPSGH
ncbi:MAG: DUF1275 domain-containing protein [Lachnospiraceae bacterium]